ncbi:MAG: type II secretion system protein [Candidatus Gastranaerophilaceae bacterium]
MPKALLKIPIFARRGLGQILRGVLPLGLLRRFAPRNDRSSQEGLEGSKAAFTLAEVLLTLTIIGIIAAMTIPGLINNTQKTENVVALKKAYSTLMQATLMITADTGGDITSVLSGLTGNSDHDGFANVFIPKLNVTKNCGTASAKATGCFPNLQYKYLDGITNWTNISTSMYHSTIILNDGMSCAFYLQSLNCIDNYADPATDTSSPLYNTCGGIRVDINGPNKGPSVVGKDLFEFELTKKGIYPRGAYLDKWSDRDCSVYGWGCASKVLIEGAMNY